MGRLYQTVSSMHTTECTFLYIKYEQSVATTTWRMHVAGKGQPRKLKLFSEV